MTYNDDNDAATYNYDDATTYDNDHHNDDEASIGEDSYMDEASYMSMDEEASYTSFDDGTVGTYLSDDDDDDASEDKGSVMDATVNDNGANTWALWFGFGDATPVDNDGTIMSTLDGDDPQWFS
mmetsp:Transcript_4510/g.10191  ORF Transcript_4510/g.10191 Transcript_4510/m.10191 type:complete len:124 (+) Transcript_4510:539-910(+)